VPSEKAEEFLEMIGRQKEVALALRMVDKKIKAIAFGYKTGRTGYVEMDEKATSIVKALLENDQITKIGYDLKEDIKNLEASDIRLNGEIFDVMLAAYVVNPGSKIDLPVLVFQELGEEMEEDKKKGQLGMELESADELARRFGARADYIFKLEQVFAEKIETVSREQKGKNNIGTVFETIELPLARVLVDMEKNGIKLNTLIFKGISEKIEVRIKNLEHSIFDFCG
jgi:DNA polymerase-1